MIIAVNEGLSDSMIAFYFGYRMDWYEFCATVY